MKILRIFSRTLVGLVFMFSGFVKGVDPLGLTYKLQEYFIAYNMEWLHGMALVFAVILCMIEFTLGVMLVFGVKPKLTAWLSLILVSFFTFLTLISAIYSPVSDCGCFGDAVKLTNWQTFYKNVVLMVFVLFLVFTNKCAIAAFKPKGEITVTILGAGFMIFISVFSLRHLPLIDFLPWKVGNKISEQIIPTAEQSEILLVYKNKETCETLEYTSKTLPYQDTVLWPKLQFIEQKKKIIREYKEAPIHDFVVSDENGNILTDKIVANPRYQFILVSYDLSDTEKDSFKEINKFVEGCDKDSISFVGLSGNNFDIIDAFRHDVQAMYPFYIVDETALRTMIRANPGLLLLKNGEVLAKWHWRDIPEYTDVKERYLK
ncbi:MAG: BT_3928 family protein [Bacteroidales bacterium]